jgi:hypothetical protein
MKSTEQSKLIIVLKSKLKQVEASFNTLFQHPVDGDLKLKEFDHSAPFALYIKLINAIFAELTIIEEGSLDFNIKNEKFSNKPDSIDYLNFLIQMLNGTSLSDELISGILEIMTAGRLFDVDHKIDIEEDQLLHFQVQHAAVLTSIGVDSIIDYMKIVDSFNGDGVTRIRPDLDDFLIINKFFELKVSKKKNLITKLRTKAQEIDKFNISRVFRYSDDEFFPVELASIRAVDKFYGYRDTQNIFMNFFSTFSKEGENFPLLISSLPGLGKTHFTISHSLAFENLTLVLPEPASLSTPLEHLIRKLSLRKNRKFVIFFDDVDTRRINWFFFRTHIGGSFVLPNNIAIVIASNYKFPANISSRGRGVVFPIFDEIECQKMVEDFLLAMGMKHPPSSLISVIAADYVEEFGQKKFEELSPRTLVRYLDRYQNDSPKRLKMLNLSREELIAKPDSQSFFDANKQVNERLLEVNF